MATWIFEPGHTEAEFRARHMMVTWVRGLFKDVRGTIEWDLGDCERTTFAGRIDATRIWTGEDERDAHLRSADFFDVENPPEIAFAGRVSERVGELQFKADTELTIRGVTRTVRLDVSYLGGVVVSNEIELTLDVEVLLLDDLERTGAIEYYREIGAV